MTSTKTTDALKIENVSEEVSLEALQTIPFGAKLFDIYFIAKGLNYSDINQNKNILNEFRQRNVVPFLEVQIKYHDLCIGETPFYSEVRRSEIGDGGLVHLSRESSKKVKEVSAEILLRGGKPHKIDISTTLSLGHEVKKTEEFYDMLKKKWFSILDENGYIPSSFCISFGSKDSPGFKLEWASQGRRNLELKINEECVQYCEILRTKTETKENIELAKQWFYNLAQKQLKK